MAHNYRSAFLLALLLMGLSTTAAHCQETFGDWAFAVSDDSSIFDALTSNDSGDELGQFCFPKKGSCVWLIVMSTSCDEGHEYPILANANSAAASLSLSCYGSISDQKYGYAFTDFNQISKLIGDNAQVGFAIPIGADRFRVVRFSLTGASESIAQMRSAARKVMGSRKVPVRKGTRDQII